MARTLAALVSVTVLIGCTPGTVRQSPATRVVSVHPSEVTTEIVGASSEQRAVLRGILAGLGPTSLTSVEIVHELAEAWGAEPDAVGIRLKARRPDRDAYWHAWLVAAAFGEQSHELGLPPVGLIDYAGDAVGSIAFGEEPSLGTMSLAEGSQRAQRIRRLAARHGAAVRRLDILQPRRLAFAVEFVAPDPADFLLNGLEPTLAPLEGADEAGHDGLHVTVFDGSGERVLENGAGFWVKRELTLCSPYMGFGGAFEPAPPPCPASP